MEQKTTELNSIIVWLLILSIIRSIIRVFTAIVAMQIYSDIFVILEIIFSIFVIAASVGIIFKNKYALIALFVLGACIAIIAFCSGNPDTGFVQLVIMGLWALIFCLKKNGQSAWKTILFDNNEDVVYNPEDKAPIDTLSTDTPTLPTTIKCQETTQENIIDENIHDKTNQEENIEAVINHESNEEDTDKFSNDFNINTEEEKQRQHKRVPKRIITVTITIILILIICLLSFLTWNKYSKTQEERFKEAKTLFKDNQTEEAIQILEDLADNDYVRAKTALGNIYLIQKSVPLNSQKGFSYLEDAAKSDTNAIHLLVRIYGGKKCKGEKFSDDSKLKKYSELALEKKCCMGEAYLNIGNIYARNNEYSNAFYYWQKATEHGSPSAHRNIGIMFYNGLGCNINYEKANNHFEKASKDTPNDPLLLLYQGLMYKYGNGTNQNLSLAKEFLKKAADKGNEDAQREYAEIELSN